MTTRMFLLTISTSLGGGCVATPPSDTVDLNAVGNDAAASGKSDGSATTGHVLIADQFNNRIIELDSKRKIVWSFGDGASAPLPHPVRSK